ncbi:MAG: hypothetical protein ACRDLB_03135 [Actinomycetota bacterium]
MKKALVVALVLGLVAGAMSAPATAKKKKKKPKKIERVVEVEYQGPGVGISTPGASVGYCYQYPVSDTCLTVIPEKGEKYIKIEVADASGTAVAGFISQGDLDGDGIGDLYGEFCGAHMEPVQLEVAGGAFDLSLYDGVCGTGPSVMTSGTIKITLSSHP